MKVEGACHCGEIRFEGEVDPQKVTVCHCTDCQVFSGGPYRSSVPASGFRLLSGKPSVFVKTAESGNKRAQGFCPKCGSPIYSSPVDDDSAAKVVRTSLLEQRDSLPPKRQIWTSSRQDWVNDLDALPAFEKQGT